MQNLYDLFGHRDGVVTSNKNTINSFNHVQDAGFLNQKSNTLGIKKKALVDVGNKINGEKTNISSISKPKAITSGLPNITQKMKALIVDENKGVQQNTHGKKLQISTSKLTHSAKPTEKIPRSVKNRINVYVEELDDTSRDVEANEKITSHTVNCEETEVVFFSDYDSFEDDDDETEGPWLPRKLFHNKEEMFDLCSIVPIRNDECCSLPDTTDVPFNIELDIPLPVNELDSFDLPLPMNVPLPW